MSTKALITKLHGIVDNDSIIKLGELRFTSTTNTFKIQAIGILKILSDGTFSDGTKVRNLQGNLESINLSQEMTQLSLQCNDSYTSGKYSLYQLLNNNSIVVEELYGCNNLEYLEIKSINTDLARLPKSILGLIINDASNLTGNIADFKKINTILINKANISGNVADIFSGSRGATAFKLSNSPNVIGDFSVFKTATSVRTIEIQNTSIVGNMSDLPASCYWVKTNNKQHWVKSARTGTTNYVLAVEGVYFDTDELDNFLIDNATCKELETAQSAWYKVIAAKGTRTSASDDAIQTLQGKGYTVSITPA